MTTEEIKKIVDDERAEQLTALLYDHGDRWFLPIFANLLEKYNSLER